jgi:hypothetical protein
MNQDPCRKSRPRSVRCRASGLGSLACLSLTVLAWGFPVAAQAQQPTAAPATGAPAGAQQTERQSSGIISGTVVDRTGAAVPSAHVRLTHPDQSAGQDITADNDGQFYFANVAPGPFQLTVTAPGLATQTSSGVLQGGEVYTVAPITMSVAAVVTEILVSPAEEAKVELQAEEKQRVLGIVPNFYVSYVPDAAPLSPKQKFQLAWKTTVDPVTFGVTAAVAGIQQASDQFAAYGQGAQGYGKRYGASYADVVTGTFIGAALLPSLLKQDPRYFYKGTGDTRSRVLYAIANAVICKGDNGRWQANYSGILGSLAAGGISNAYYPSNDRGAGLTFENTLVGIGASAAANILQEFIIRKLTPNVPNRGPAKS